MNSDRLSAPRRALLEQLRRSHGAAQDDARTAVLMRPPRPARLILLHPSGGELFSYIPLVRALRDGIGVAGFAADQRDTTVPAREGIATAASRIVRALAGTELPASYCLAGWSYGGVLAFEIARQLEQDTGARPPVVLLDAWDDSDLVPLDEPTLRRRFVHDVARLAGRDDAAVGAVLDDPAEGQADIRDIRTALVALRVDVELSDAELARRYAIFRSNALALQAYRPPSPYGGPVTLLAASPSGALAQRWRAVCTGRFRSEGLRGDHYTLFREPALSRIVAEIERTLAP